MGLKSGIKGIQGEFHTSILAPLEIEIQAPLLITIPFFNKPFQSQEEEGLGETFKKDIPFSRYLPLSTSTQRLGAFIVNFQPSLASKEWLWNSKGLIPSLQELLVDKYYPKKENKESVSFPEENPTKTYA
jgi:hypothetical protein